MDSCAGKPFEPWKAVKFLNNIKLSKICKQIFRNMCLPSTPPHAPGDDPAAFMTCVIEVDTSKPGWYRSISKAKANCGGDTRFKLDGNGLVRISGIGDPDRVMKKLAKSSRTKIRGFEYGQCSKYLFAVPDAKPITSVSAQPKQDYDNNPRPLPPNQGYYYGYHLQQQPPYLGHVYDPYQLGANQGYYGNPHQQQPSYLGYPSYSYQPPDLLPYGYY